MMLHLEDKTEDLSPGHSLSDGSEGPLLRGGGWWGGGSQDLKEFLQQRPASRNIKRSLFTKGSETSLGKEFGPFLCVRRCEVRAH